MEVKHKEVYEIFKDYPEMMRSREMIRRDYPDIGEKLNAAYKDGCIGFDKDTPKYKGLFIWWKC